MLTALGRTTFEDSFIPVPNKNEFGMDTLSRRVEGYAGGLVDYIRSLRQGQTYEFDGILFYLQTWNPGNSTPVASVDLHYKGLTPGGTPEVDVQRRFVSAIGRTSQDYSDEGTPLGVGRLYGTGVFASIGENIPIEGTIGTSIAWSKKFYALSAFMEFEYIAVEAVFRYIAVGEPVAARHSSVGVNYTLVVNDARIVTSPEGTVFGRDMEGFFDLQPSAKNRVVSFESKNVKGSPYWECQDTVMLELGNP